MLLIKNLLLLFGMGMLGASLCAIRSLIVQLPKGKTTVLWHLLMLLVLLFLSGYGGYLIIFWHEYRNVADLIVPFIFFFGAVFVVLVCYLAFLTTRELKKILILEYENTIDCLTGIYNRRYLERRLPEEFSRSLRYGFPLSLAMIDIDHFKALNDHYGHQNGDKALKEMATLLQSSIRESDVLCRYGGEEFLIILPHTNQAEALRMAENLRQAVAREPFFGAFQGKIEGGPVRLTVSVGIAFHHDLTESTDKLLNRADQALYLAKAQGRNRVVCFQDM